MTTPPERWLLDTNVWIFGTIKDLPVELVTAEEAQSRLAEFLP